MGAIEPSELLMSENLDHLASAAYDVGTAIVAGTGDLEELRRSIAAALPLNELGKGVRLALEEVLSGVIAAARHERDLSERRKEARLKPNWIKVLTALQQGDVYPGDIHKTTSISEPNVSRAIRELSDAGYVERIARTDDDDARTRPIRLTLQGIEVAGKHPPADDVPLDAAMVKKIAAFSARLITHRSLHVTAPPPPGIALWLHTLEELAAIKISKQPQRVEVRNVLDSDYLRRALYRVRRCQDLTPLQGLLEAVKGPMPVLVRAQLNRDAWELALTQIPDRNRFHVVTEAELISGAESIPDKDFLLFYDAPQLSWQDLNHSDSRVNTLIARGHQTLCFYNASDGGSLPPAVHAVQITA